MSVTKNPDRCVQCRRVASVYYQRKAYCRTCADQLLGVKPRPRPRLRKSAAKKGVKKP